MNVFAKATKSKLRFSTGRGHLTTEDLWDLSLKDLDRLAVEVHRKVGDDQVSFLDNPDPRPSTGAAEDKLRLDVLKEVIRIKQDENRAKRAAGEAQRRRAMFQELIAKKRMEGLHQMSLAELEKQLEEIDNPATEEEAPEGQPAE